VRIRFSAAEEAFRGEVVWGIMAGALADERHIQFPPGRVRRDLEEVVAWVKQRGLHGDPVLRRRIAELLWRQSLWETIGGGTSEILRGVVAKQALGLGGR